METNFAALRKEFPVLERKTYLNSGSYCALANDVKASIEAYMEDRLAVGANWDVWITKNEAVRALTAQLLGAAPDEIAVTASVSAGLNALASALDFTGKRNKVVISDFEFPTNAQIWHAQEPRGAKVVHVARDATGYIPAEKFADAIDENTQLVAITHVCFRNGAKLEIPEIVRIARAKGAMVLLDCYQAVGSMDINVKKLDVDFAVGGMLKYLLGTAGIGFMYVRDSFTKSLVPTNSGWFAQENIAAMDITGITRTRARAASKRAPRRSLIVMPPSRSEVFVRRRDADHRKAQSGPHPAGAWNGWSEIGWPSVTPTPDARRGATVCVPSRDAGALSRELMTRDIVTSHRDANLRASFISTTTKPT